MFSVDSDKQIIFNERLVFYCVNIKKSRCSEQMETVVEIFI